MRLGALHGIIAWTAYAIVECAFSSILLWGIEPQYDYVPVHVGFMALLFAVYPAIGAITGGLLGLALGKIQERTAFAKAIEPASFFPAATTLTVVAAFVVNLLAEDGLDTFNLPPLLISIVLMIALISSAGSSIWSRRLRFLTHPVVASLLVIGLPWVTSGLLVGVQSVAAKAAGLVLYSATVLLLSFGVPRIMRGRSFDSGNPGRPARTLGSLLTGALVVVGLGALLQRVAVPPLPSPKPTDGAGDRPNVIVISLDTVRADHLSPYGYKRDTTPTLKRFSGEATLYTNAVAASDMTYSSHASIFTGMYPSRHGAHFAPPRYLWRGRPLRNGVKTLAEILSEQGYLTMSVVANYVQLRVNFGIMDGFEYCDQRTRGNFLHRPSAFYLSRNVRSVLTWFAPAWTFANEFRTAEEINREVFRLLGHVQQENARFFLFVNYLDAHWPYVSPPPFDSAEPPPAEAYAWNDFHRLMGDVMTFERPLGEEQRRRLESLYDLGLTYLDLHVGKLFAHLKELGLYDKALIIVTSDHGEAFGDKHLLEHGVSTYQDLLHVPLIIKYPHQSGATIVSERVSAVDIMPTILDVLGYEVPSFAEGESLRAVGIGRSRAVISESFPGNFVLGFGPRFQRIERAIFSGSFKFISSTTGKRELYDLSTDPNEEHNIIDSHGETATELEAGLGRWLADVEVGSRSSVTPGQGPGIDAADKERLRALGYMP